MFNKKIILGEINMIEDASVFPKGTRFVFDGRIGTVIDVREADNAQMRRIVYNDGTDEIVTLQTLIKDSKLPGFSIMDDGIKNA